MDAAWVPCLCFPSVVSQPSALRVHSRCAWLFAVTSSHLPVPSAAIETHREHICILDGHLPVLRLSEFLLTHPGNDIFCATDSARPSRSNWLTFPSSTFFRSLGWSCLPARALLIWLARVSIDRWKVLEECLAGAGWLPIYRLWLVSFF